MPDGVTVAQLTLTQFVGVRIPIGQLMRVVVKGRTYRSESAGLYGFRVHDEHGAFLHSCMLFEEDDNRYNLALVKEGDFLAIEESVKGYAIYRIEEVNGVEVYFDWVGEGF